MKKNYLLLFLFALLLTNSYGQDIGCVRVNANTPLPICNVGDSRTITASPPINSVPRQTTSYNISQTPFVWRSPDNINDITSITSDDKWSAVIPLRGKQTVPFNFCYFGQKYSDCLIGDNGVVTFSILGHPDSPGGLYRPSFQVPAESGSGWAFNVPIPSGPGYGPPYKSAIMMLQDLNIANNPTSTSTINYFTVGTYPCRAFVANWQDVPHFSCNPTVQGYQSYQIVLFESTNIIEIHVRKRTSCPNWNGGNGLLGIQNADGSIAYSPTSPNRNTGTWQVPETQSEAWRFTPSGPMVPVTYQWYEQGNPGTIIGTGPNLTVTPAVTTTYCVVATFGSCSPSIPPITTQPACAPVKVGEPVGFPPKNIKHCTTDTNPRVFDIGINTDVILGTTVPGPPNNLNPYDFDINYYENLADAQNDANPINTAFYDPSDTDAPVLYTLPAPDMTKTVYIKILDVISNCSYILPFDLILRDCDAQQIAPIILCDIGNDSQENFNLNDELPAINAAIAAETGNPLPADFSITFHESETDADDVSTALTPAEVMSYPATTGDRVYVRAESIADPTFYYVYYFDLRLVPTPIATISGTTQICENSTATITITGTAGATVRYTDHTGATVSVVLVDDGTGTNTGVYIFTTPAVIPANSPYTYTLVDASLTTSGVTCTQPLTGSAVVTVGGLPTADITTANTPICEGTALAIDVLGTPGTTVTYTDPAGLQQTLLLDGTGHGTINFPTTAAPGTYTYTLVKVSTASTPPCEQNLTDSVTITVRPLPTATIHQVDTQVCLGNPSRVIIRGQPNATVTYLIDSAADQKILDATGEYVILEVLPTAGTHTYTLAGVRSADAPFCVQPASGSVTIEVTDAPVATISTSTPVI
ncbi:hypothetical protein ABH942_003199, partial [Flavobacterium sp. 28YEA47A]